MITVLYFQKWKIEKLMRLRINSRKHYYKHRSTKVERARQWRIENRDRYRASQKKYYLKNRKKIIEKHAQRLKNNPLLRKRRWFRQKHKISWETYNRWYVKVNGKCAICQQQEDTLFIDHNHQTGKIRGLLCRNCNSGLGFFKDNVLFLSTAINYLNNPPLRGETL